MTPFNPLAVWGLGGGELLVILLIILVLFGAKRLPELARSLGQAKKEFGKATREVSEELNKTEPQPPASPPSSSDHSDNSSKKT